MDGFASQNRYIAEMISVNPGKSTLGTLNGLKRNVTRAIPRKHVLDNRRSERGLLSFILPKSEVGIFGSAILFLLRICYAVSIIAFESLAVDTIFASTGIDSALISVFCLLLAASVAFGFFERITLLLPTVILSLAAITSPTFQSGLVPAALSIAGMAIMVFGSGWFSADALMRRMIIKKRNRKEIPAKALEDLTLPLVNSIDSL